MEVVIAASAGFCMGVRRAIEIALQVAAEEKGPVYTYGPLIHNPQELEALREKGVIVLSDSEPLPKAPVIIRAHGVTPAVHARLSREAERVVDVTCPKVARIQKRIAEFSTRGYAVVIAGDSDHPEVVGLVGHAEGNAYVVSSPADVDRLPELDRVVLVAQTTQDQQVFDAIRSRVLARFPHAQALSTICESTHRRQNSAREVAQRVDAMVVIGGRNSANTRRLAEICASLEKPAYHIEVAGELPLDELRHFHRVGVTAGASTPAWIIEEVVRILAGL
ncbi:MAG: 4-hydroxy-3-methylbut-2-enyl diphosphate reductase [Deltaproteobacteria bacterium]|nr:4-hydroxy-3-methylbut-2-enyl diphosphate reductase [Deltaproteobacteria bacterium]